MTLLKRGIFERVSCKYRGNLEVFHTLPIALHIKESKYACKPNL